MKEVELKLIKKTLKPLGYKTQVKHFSEFSKVYIVHIETNSVLNDSTVFSAEYLAKHKAAFEIINQYKTMIIKNEG